MASAITILSSLESSLSRSPENKLDYKTASQKCIDTLKALCSMKKLH